MDAATRSKPRTRSKPSTSPKPKRVTSRLHVQMVPLSELMTWPGNPKEHDLETLGESFERFGYVEPIVYDEGTKRIVAGHGRREKLLAWKDAGKSPPERVTVRNGEWYVPVLRGVSFRSAHEAEAYLVTSNESVIRGGYNGKLLAEMLSRHVDDATGIGWKADEIRDLIEKSEKATQSVYNEVTAEDEPHESAKPPAHTCPNCGANVVCS